MKINKNNFILQLQLHNEKALMYVIDEYGGLLNSIIHKHLFTRPDCQEECFNDVLLRIWNNIDRFDEAKNNFKNWIAAIAYYRSIDYLRQYQREQNQISIENTEISQEDIMLKRLIEKEFSEELESMLSYLNPLDRQLFIKLYVEEESIEHISQETGMQKSIIYNHISRGKKKIRNHFSIRGGV